MTNTDEIVTDGKCKKYSNDIYMYIMQRVHMTWNIHVLRVIAIEWEITNGQWYILGHLNQYGFFC